MNYFFNNGFAHLKIAQSVSELFPEKGKDEHSQYSIIWVKEGMLDLAVNDVLVPVNENQMTFITPSNNVRVLSDHSSVIGLQFNREFYCIRENDHEVSCDGILYFGTQGVPIVTLSDKDTESFDRLLGVLKEEFEILDTIQEEMLRTILKKWLIKSTRMLKLQNKYVVQKEVKAEGLRQFIILVEKNFKQLHKVKDYAQLLNKSPKTMANQFKMLGQQSPSSIIQERIIVEAKRYLLYSQLSVKEISFELGFDNAPTFSHYFKSQTSLSPKHFKELYHKV